MLIYISHNKNTANLNQCCCCFSANISNFVITQKHQLINWDKAMNENNEIFRLFWIYNIIIIYDDSMADVKVVFFSCAYFHLTRHLLCACKICFNFFCLFQNQINMKLQHLDADDDDVDDDGMVMLMLYDDDDDDDDLMQDDDDDDLIDLNVLFHNDDYDLLLMVMYDVNVH